MLNLLTVLAGALLFLWPAVLNGYPIVYSDTGGFLEQALMPDMGWDKPWIYGPFLTPFHAGITLWPAILAQAMILSALLWLTLLTFVPGLARPRARLVHLGICLLLSAVTAAPWFAATVMPDIFAPLTVLGLALLALGRLHRPALLLVGVVTTLAIAVHLAHLIVAAACLAALSLLTGRLLWRQATPLVAALLLLVLSNVVGNGLVAVSPYGSVFALARMVADGPAATVIRRDCPASGWHLCAWADRLPADSDDFLWDPEGPVWASGRGPIRLAPEAAAIVRRTVLTEPVALARAALHNTAIQLLEATVGDTLIPDHLDVAVVPRLQAYFPPAEVARFQAGRQARGALPALAEPLNPLYSLVLILGTLGTVAVAALCWRRAPDLSAFALVVLVGLGANALATGALSHPHDRYQARIAWLVVLVPALAVVRLRPAVPLRRRPRGGGSCAR